MEDGPLRDALKKMSAMSIVVSEQSARIAELEAALDDFLMHCVDGPTSAWMMISRTEFESIMRRGCLTPKRKQGT